ncbi:SNF2 family N-terminal domain-containing protein [Kalaharituber pfeilii]|nr:SNF2 family N-terminal domain-containing protein [Kalaharituber pfeilii]
MSTSTDKNWLRLQFLLKQSKVYASILAEKMTAQMEAQKAKDQKERMRLRKEQEAAASKQPNVKEEERKEEPAQGTRTTRSGKTDAQAQLALATKKARGREKRDIKATGSNTISKFLNPNTIGEATSSTTEALAEAAVAEDSERFGQQTSLRSARQPKLVTGGIMKPYQLEGLDWLCSLYENGLNGILADEMGLGKTLQTISFLAFLREKGSYGPFLIVAPVSTLSNWVDEIERFTPDMPVVLYHGTPQERETIRNKRLKKLGSGFPIVCTSYELVMKDRKWLQRYSWSFIIIDEGHRIKNLNCKLIRELKSYSSANRLLLTGTPLQNNLSELWSLLNFLLPDIFDDLDSFQNWFDFSALREKEGHKHILEADRKTQIVSSLHAILKPFLLRRIKADVETQLPPKREYVLYAPLTQEQKDLYRALVERRGREYLIEKLMSLKAEKENLGSRGYKRRLGNPDESAKPLMKRIKLTPLNETEINDPTEEENMKERWEVSRKRKKTDYRELEDDEWFDKLDNGELLTEDNAFESCVDEKVAEYEKQLTQATKEISSKKLQNLVMQLHSTLITSSGKLLLLDRLLLALFSRGHKVLIFSQFATQLDILSDYAEELRGWPVARIDGAVKFEDRREQIKRFNEDPEWKLFLLSTRAGGLGINLTSADTVILFDSDWNPQMDLQAMDRAHRIGQKRSVVVYRFATGGTVEEVLLEKADAKRRLEKLVIQKGKFRSVVDGVGKDAGDEREGEGEGDKELERILMKEEFEKVKVVGEGSVLLSDEELEVLLDRSPEAYERAERGEERAVLGRRAFRFVKKEEEQVRRKEVEEQEEGATKE